MQSWQVMDQGDRMLIWCNGVPSVGRAVYPPPLEVEVAGGIYVLVDDGSEEQWHYEFVTEDRLRMTIGHPGVRGPETRSA